MPARGFLLTPVELLLVALPLLDQEEKSPQLSLLQLCLLQVVDNLYHLICAPADVYNPDDFRNHLFDDQVPSVLRVRQMPT